MRQEKWNAEPSNYCPRSWYMHKQAKDILPIAVALPVARRDYDTHRLQSKIQETFPG